jgi:hypothetical protein
MVTLATTAIFGVAVILIEVVSKPSPPKIGGILDNPAPKSPAKALRDKVAGGGFKLQKQSVITIGYIRYPTQILGLRKSFETAFNLPGRQAVDTRQ